MIRLSIFAIVFFSLCLLFIGWCRAEDCRTERDLIKKLLNEQKEERVHRFLLDNGELVFPIYKGDKEIKIFLENLNK